MCTRFHAEREPLSELIIKAQKNPLSDALMNAMKRPKTMSGDICPTDMAAVLAPNKEGRAAVFPMIWGFAAGADTKPVINCRLETAAVRPLWKDSWQRRRCVIPASWYYEWGCPSPEDGGRKEKFVIQPRGAEITYLAGLYRFEEHQGVQVPVFAVITREPVPPVSNIHDRMPLILSRESLPEWISPGGDPVRVSRNALTEMIMEKAE